MDTWLLLKKELSFYGIRLLNHRECIIFYKNGKVKKQGIFKTIKQINFIIKKQKKILLDLWTESIELLEQKNPDHIPVDSRMIDLFIFSLKDMAKFLLCFDEVKTKYFREEIEKDLTQDIVIFNKEQIYKLPDYKISIDWVHRIINKSLYIMNLLSFASMGPKKISRYNYKVAHNVSGPWSNLDLPLCERVFPFGTEVQKREKAKRKQRRYRKGLENYNSGEFVGEGHYWRELRNEPFDWANREYDDPYPSRNLLSR